MKTPIIILSALTLSGCFYQSVDQFDIERAIVACNGHQNIAYIQSHARGVEFVQCKNINKIINLSDVTIPTD